MSTTIWTNEKVKKELENLMEIEGIQTRNDAIKLLLERNKRNMRMKGSEDPIHLYDRDRIKAIINSEIPDYLSNQAYDDSQDLVETITLLVKNNLNIEYIADLMENLVQVLRRLKE